jgi:DNA polymerase-1
VHYNVWQILSTGRISVSEPNLNQIPSKGDLGKQIRNCFVAKEGYKIVGGDFSGMELRIIAEFSKDPLWINAFNDGQDLHSVLCAATFDIPITDVKQETPFKKGVSYRDIQKTINFGLAYGMSKFKLADTMQIPVGEADKIIKKFFKVVPNVERFLNSLGELAKARGYIKTGQPYGRVRWFDGYDDKQNFVRQGEIERAGKNTPIQGTNGDIIKSALIKVQRFIDSRSLPINILLSVYDEIQTECPEDLAEWWKTELDRLMVESAQEVIKSIPIVVDCKIANYWDK